MGKEADSRSKRYLTKGKPRKAKSNGIHRRRRKRIIW
jgi:hypothetical protein